MDDKNMKFEDGVLYIDYKKFGDVKRVMLQDEIFCKEFYSGEDMDIQDPKEIVHGCIYLMQKLTGQFEDYLEFMDVKPESNEERFATTMTYFEIVRDLLLWTTRHSGGNSTMKLCHDLGFDYSQGVLFRDERDMEGEEDGEV